jgi:hypothetical protein
MGGIRQGTWDRCAHHHKTAAECACGSASTQVDSCLDIGIDARVSSELYQPCVRFSTPSMICRDLSAFYAADAITASGCPCIAPTGQAHSSQLSGTV